MGLYTNFRADMIAKGMDQQTASRIAAHWANRYAGALPKEAMSDAATKVSNMLLFSRSFTLGNLGVLKDMFTGLPKDVLAQIERDAGFKAGSIEAGIEAGRRPSRRASRLPAARPSPSSRSTSPMHVGNSLLQSAKRAVQRLDAGQGVARLYPPEGDAAGGAEHPLKLLQPFNFLEHLSATSENEPGKQGAHQGRLCQGRHRDLCAQPGRQDRRGIHRLHDRPARHDAQEAGHHRPAAVADHVERCRFRPQGLRSRRRHPGQIPATRLG
jgi:hypothetical protein